MNGVFLLLSRSGCSKGHEAQARAS